MVKIERLQEWADSDKCLSVMVKRRFINLYGIFLINVVYVLRRPASKAVLHDSRALGELPSLYGFSAE